jgi:2'-5' RNA ligase
MEQQATLFDVEPPPKHTDRLFFAFYPDAATASERIAPLATRLRASQRLHGKILAPERFHVTLHHIGDFAGLPQQLVKAVSEAAASVKFPRFEVAFDFAASFGKKPGRSHPFVLQGDSGVQRIVEFRRLLGEALKQVGIKPDASFTPHVTLLYDDRVVPPQPVVPPVRWEASDFVLVHSLIGRGVHIPLARWPLG